MKRIVFYHAAHGKQKGAYYGITTGKTRKIKFVGIINTERIDELLAPLIKPAKEQLEAILSYMKV